MKKSKNRSELSLKSVKSDIQNKEEIYVPPLDVLTVKILDLHVPDEDPKPYALKVTFFDQLLLSSVVTSTSGRKVDEDPKRSIAKGYMNYDPSDYEKMCLFANNPLTIRIYPAKTLDANLSDAISSTGSQSNKSSTALRKDTDVYCCNIDILPIFMNTNEMHINKCMEPMIMPSVLLAKSWDNFPKISLTLKSNRNKENEKHHKMFRKANYFKFTLIGCYNFIIPYSDKIAYTAATKLPLPNETQSSVFTFNNGRKPPNRFNNMSFYSHWESLRLQDEVFTRGDEKFQCNIKELQNFQNIDLEHKMNLSPKCYTTIWASFHRTLLLKDTERWLSEHIRQHKWPLEVHAYGEDHGYSFMAFIDLFKLLYPGERTTRVVVPLQWINAESMLETCGCELLLASNERVLSPNSQRVNRERTEPTNSNNEESVLVNSTGYDATCAFAIVEVTLARAFKQPVIPSYITQPELNKMMTDIESMEIKRECSGRGQLDHAWQATVRSAATSLRHVPYYGVADLCAIIKQLSLSRTRVELVTSFWQDAAVYVNNNFVVSDFLHTKDTYEEMLMIAHACLMKITYETLKDTNSSPELNSTLRAARHSRQLQDLRHATDLFLQLVVEKPREADNWRELATCLRDIDKDWANICINKSLLLNPRHPLSLLSKGCMVFEDDPDAAEPFFVALLALYPYWVTVWVAANAYYLHREMFNMAKNIMEQIKKTKAVGLLEEMRYSRAWERELGDWWDNTPLLPGTSLYYDAADLLLRLRAITLAEVCIARALSETGESPVYYHMVALCCRLKGRVEDALCHLQQGIEKFGEISYLRSLEGECHHKLKDFTLSMASFNKTGSCGSPYVTLLSLPRHDRQRTRTVLSDIVRRHPSAYAWIAFAEDWITNSDTREGGDADAKEERLVATSNAANCATRALNCDRRAGRAWALLASLLSPSARRQYCKEMATMCGYNKPIEEHIKTNLGEEASFCYRLGKVLRECRCKMCENLTI